jgi:hypothetical protein
MRVRASWERRTKAQQGGPLQPSREGQVLRTTRNHSNRRRTFLGSGDEDVDAGMLHVNPHAAAGYAVKHEEGSYTLGENEKGKSNMWGVCVCVCASVFATDLQREQQQQAPLCSCRVS